MVLKANFALFDKNFADSKKIVAQPKIYLALLPFHLPLVTMPFSAIFNFVCGWNMFIYIFNVIIRIIKTLILLYCSNTYG